MTKLINDNENIKLLYEEILKIIENSKKKVQLAVNSEIVILYWNIGKIIRTEVLKDHKAEYGKSIISGLSRQLKSEYGRGYSERNLFNMVRFYDVISNIEILQTLSAKLSWSHL